jgi:hypothetical protein
VIILIFILVVHMSCLRFLRSAHGGDKGVAQGAGTSDHLPRAVSKEIRSDGVEVTSSQCASTNKNKEKKNKIVRRGGPHSCSVENLRRPKSARSC